MTCTRPCSATTSAIRSASCSASARNSASLSPEVVEDRAAGQAGLLQAAHRGALVAVAGEAGPGAVEDLLPPRGELVAADPGHAEILRRTCARVPNSPVRSIADRTRILSVAGGSVSTRDDATDRGGAPATRRRPACRAARRADGRGLRRVGLLQARAPAAGRGGARVAGARPPPPARPAGPPDAARRARHRTPRPRSTRRPRPVRCPAAPWSPSSPAARSSWPARRCPISARWSRTAVADADVLHRLLAAARPRRRSPGRRRRGPPARRILDLPALPRHGAGLRPASARTAAAAMCSTAAVQVCLDAGEPAEIGRRWAAVHALGPGAARGVRQLRRVLHGRRTGWKSSRLAAWLRPRPGPHRAARRPHVPADPAAAWARHVLDAPRAVRAAARRPAGSRRPASRSPTGSTARRAAGPPTRRPRLPRLHAVPAGAPARPPGGALPRHASRAALGAAGGGADGAAVRPGRDRPRRATPASRRAAAGSSAARHGLADPCSPRAAVAVFELALPALPAARRRRAWRRPTSLDAGDRRRLPPRDGHGATIAGRPDRVPGGRETVDRSTPIDRRPTESAPRRCAPASPSCSRAARRPQHRASPTPSTTPTWSPSTRR